MKREILFIDSQINEGRHRVAASINEHYSVDLGKPVVTIPILNGGMFFYVDLVRELTFPLETGIISTSHYPNGREVRNLSIKYFDADIKDRKVLLVDEICYTGHTLLYLKNLLLEQGALEVKTAVLLNQPKEHERIMHIPDWAALNYYGKEWSVGQGMDLKGLYRNSKNIFYFKED